jgi:hypothetical protein
VHLEQAAGEFVLPPDGGKLLFVTAGSGTLRLDGDEHPLGRHVAALADGALLDTRVLMAHRLGAAESSWPAAEDRFASDLLDPGAVGDRWLHDLTAAAATSSATGPAAPILLGGHTLVNGGLRLLAQRAMAAAR